MTFLAGIAAGLAVALVLWVLVRELRLFRRVDAARTPRGRSVEVAFEGRADSWDFPIAPRRPVPRP